MVSPTLALLLFACHSSEPAAPDPTLALRQLTRASLDVRGVRPSDEEIEAIQADPEALEDLLDEIIRSERLPERLVDLYNELYLTRSEASAINTQSLGMAEKEPFLQMVGQEPLRLLAQVAAEDLPYTEIVLADWTMVNETMAEHYPVSDYPEGATGWQKVHYGDGRPAGGVLVTNGLWWRYVTTASNANRGRANQVSRLLLCADYLSRDVETDPELFLLSDAELADALQTDPACANCHVSLDPLAGHFGGFFLSNYTSVQEALLYHPAREEVWRSLSGVAPGYFGTPTEGLVDLGAQISADPRFVSCAVEQAWTLLLREPPGLEDQEELNRIREAFLAGGLTIRGLFRAVLDVPAWRDLEDGDAPSSAKVATVELLASQVEELTGFRWVYEEQEIMRADKAGLHLIGGGVDGISQVSPPSEPTPGLVLAQRALAELAASYAVDREAPLPRSARRLFTAVSLDANERPETAALGAQIVVLHRRLYGEILPADSEEVGAGVTLWEQLYAQEADPLAAWRGLLCAMLRDPRLVLY